MKQQNIKILLALLISMLGIKAFAYIEVKNTDGVTIYYSYISSTDLEVTSQGDSYKYAGKVVIPESVTYNGTTFSVSRIGDNAFYGCRGLTSINIPNSVISIGDYAFSGCSGLTSITIPNSVTSIEHSAFYGTAWYDNQPDGLVYAGKVAYKYKGTMPSNTNIVLEEGTLGIAGFAFYKCSGLASITIPNSVTNIGQSAFEGTTWYNNQPDGLVYAGKVAYKYKGTIPSNTNIVLEEGTLGIAGSAFYKCNGLASITIPNSVTSIGNYAFCNCNGLTSITIPESVTIVNESAFENCFRLKDVELPKNLKQIMPSAFRWCSSLESITIPGTIEYIYPQAFSDCSKLKSVSIEAETPPFLAENSFSNYDILLYVPEESVGLYQTTSPWSKFSEVKPLSGAELERCAKPTITLKDGKLSFSSETEGVTFVSHLTAPAITADSESPVIDLPTTYTITVYAKKEGMKNSETATMTFDVRGLKGDVDGDGYVNAVDLTRLIEILLE